MKRPSVAGGRWLRGSLREAALRFNQAYLVSPEQSRVYHGLAVIAQMRFNDLDVRRRAVPDCAEAAQSAEDASRTSLIETH